ncbi:SDR family oxidoreductase [Corallococcus macrosporus]|uniref:NAD-dependent epimerase/dehydratase family protein n=1 Tax=Myxococcus fulvus (strain ATCC BAA-855 / HW-1) TaxID=483219 RepID=F8C7F7_MYXFH|nr:SDR family oxidoreductase [Corallococcus macrosporus]AEI63155.1 NAD-dependent epimerase/dehydratase family protein [Corallococcus macrosporus]
MTLSRRSVIQGAAAAGSLWAMGCATTGTSGAAAPSTQGQGAQSSAPAAPLRILILGGTAFLGPALVEFARSRGHTVTLFNRGKTNPGLFPDVEKLAGDRDPNKGQGLKALEGRQWDAVVDTSGYVPRVVRASAELLAPHVKHYTFVSSISVYKELSRQGLDETAAVATVDDATTEEVDKHYGALKALCEQAAEAAMPGRVLNVRPGLIVGPDDPSDRFTYWPLRVARGGEVLAPGDGKDPIQFIDARDLAAFIIRSVERNTTGIFNATGPGQDLLMRDFLEANKTTLGSDARFTWVDTDFLTKHKVEPWGDIPAWVPRTGEEGGIGKVSIAKALAAGITFRPATETIRETLAWFKTLPPERQAKPRSGLSAEREKEVLAAWHQERGTANAG